MPRLKRRINEAFQSGKEVYLCYIVNGNDVVSVFRGPITRITRTVDNGKESIDYIVGSSVFTMKSTNYCQYHNYILCLTPDAAAKAVKTLLKEIQKNKQEVKENDRRETLTGA